MRRRAAFVRAYTGFARTHTARRPIPGVACVTGEYAKVSRKMKELEDEGIKNRPIAEQLAVMSTKLEQLDTRLEAMDTRLEQLGTGQNELGVRLDTRLQEMDTRLEEMDTRLEQLGTGQNELGVRLDTRLEQLGMRLEELGPQHLDRKAETKSAKSIASGVGGAVVGALLCWAASIVMPKALGIADKQLPEQIKLILVLLMMFVCGVIAIVVTPETVEINLGLGKLQIKPGTNVDQAAAASAASAKPAAVAT